MTEEKAEFLNMLHNCNTGDLTAGEMGCASRETSNDNLMDLLTQASLLLKDMSKGRKSKPLYVVQTSEYWVNNWDKLGMNIDLPSFLDESRGAGYKQSDRIFLTRDVLL